MSDKIKLLIIDDEVKFLNSIAKRLDLRGFEVRKATNGREAIEASRTDQYHLALLDLKMPGMDGTEVLKILKKENKFIEVIILTGHGSLDSSVECTKLGAFNYLSKPYELEKLLEILKQAYEERMKKKFQSNAKKMEKLAQIAVESSPLHFLREMRKLDDDIK